MKKKKKQKKTKQNQINEQNETNGSVSISSKQTKSNPLKTVIVSIVLLVFISSSILFFLINENQEDRIFNQTKKYLLDKLKKEGPSVEVYKALSEIYRNKNSSLQYAYLKQAFNLIKPQEIAKHRDIIKMLLDLSYTQNESEEQILKYLILLYSSTKPSNPEFFEIVSSLVEIYNTNQKFDQSFKILSNLKTIYSQNMQIKYLLCNTYYLQGNLGKARKELQEMIDYRKKNKQPLSFNELSMYYLISKNYQDHQTVIQEVVRFAWGLSSNELAKLMMFLVDRTDITFQDYKLILAKIGLYRPEIHMIVDKIPYIHLELGKKLWILSNYTLAELYFSKAINLTNPELRKIVQDYIYQIKSKYNDTKQSDIKSLETKILNTKDILQDVK
ncbi:MAG: hypothetical protein ABDH21_04655 [bacterium]